MTPNEQQIIEWITQDEARMQALRAVKTLGLEDECLAAGFVRNLVWDRLHGYQQTTPLNDIDVVYFNPHDLNPLTDLDYEQRLNAIVALPWSVKNQARMHLKYGRAPYRSTRDAISYWVETETAIGVRLDEHDALELVAPLGVDSLFAFTISANPQHGQPEVLLARAEQKGWITRWPKLRIEI